MTDAKNVGDEAALIKNHRQRASKNVQMLDRLTRTQAKDKIVECIFAGELTQGEALKRLRVQVLGVKQEQFAQLVKVSRKTLSDIENDKGNYSVDTLNQVFRPFGLQVGLVKI